MYIYIQREREKEGVTRGHLQTQHAGPSYHDEQDLHRNLCPKIQTATARRR